jgi:hypothetical protein
MSLIKLQERREASKKTAKDLIPPLILFTLGIIAVVLLYLLPGRNFQPIELMLLILVVGAAALGYRQRILRGIMTLVILYFASGMAATFYPFTAPYIGAPLGEKMTNAKYALSFVVLMLAIWIALEAIGRQFFKDTSLPGLGFLDNLGGVFLYLIFGILLATLLFNAIGYGSGGRRSHDKAELRSAFRTVLNVHYTAQSFWFPRRPPLIYTYDLIPPEEP